MKNVYGSSLSWYIKRFTTSYTLYTYLVIRNKIGIKNSINLFWTIFCSIKFQIKFININMDKVITILIYFTGSVFFFNMANKNYFEKSFISGSNSTTVPAHFLLLLRSNEGKLYFYLQSLYFLCWANKKINYIFETFFF